MRSFAGRAIENPDNETRILLVLLWAVAVASLYLGAGLNSLSTDDAMRLVEVRDFLSGQGWFDLTQYRLDPPGGVAMHWSRLIDLPLALMIKSATLIVPVPRAEQAALVVWPTALLLVFLAGVARLARDLAGQTAARLALIFSVLMAPVLQHFRTGAIDHHNVQLALTIWSLAFFARAPWRARDGALAGGLCAVSVAVGQEMAPAVAVLASVAALRWVVAGDALRTQTVALATALAAGTVILAIATIPPARYLVVDCDALSIAQAGVLGLGGFGLAALVAMARQQSIAVRLAAAAVLAVMLGAAVAVGAPECLGDPYAKLDPRLIELWLSSVNEGRDIFSLMHDLPQQVPVYFGIPIAGLALGTLCCLRENDGRRWPWIACVATQAVFIVLAAWEVRVAAGANAVGAVLVPAGLLKLMPARAGSTSYLGLPRPVLLIILLLNPVALIALGSGAARAFEGPATPAQRIVAGGDDGTCTRPTDYAPLATLPRGRVAAFIDAGPFILMQSNDDVLAAPYHRNAAGNLAMLDIFLSPPDVAKAQLAAHAIDYVAFCRDAPERYNYARAAPNGLAAALASNDVPAFLQRIPLAGTDLSVYRVVR